MYIMANATLTREDKTITALKWLARGLIALGIMLLASMFLIPVSTTFASSFEYQDEPLTSPHEKSPTYLSLLDGADAEGYAACMSIAASGEVADPYEVGPGWAPVSCTIDDMDVQDLLWYVGYDEPLYTAYISGSRTGHFLAMDFFETSLRIDTPATRAEDGFAELYAKVDEAIRPMEKRAYDANIDSTEGYIRELASRIAEGASYSYDDVESAHCNDIYGAAVLGKSCCLGFSAEMKYALDLAGVTNIIAYGKCDGESHAWNMVKVSGKWVMVDVTAMSIMMDDQGVSRVKELASPWKFCMRDLDALNMTATGTGYVMSQQTAALIGAE